MNFHKIKSKIEKLGAINDFILEWRKNEDGWDGMDTLDEKEGMKDEDSWDGSSDISEDYTEVSIKSYL